MENKEELQNLIADLRSKLGDNSIDVQLLEDLEGSDEPSATNAEQQSEPGEELPLWLASLILEGANEIMRVLEGGEVPTTEITPIDESAESMEAMQALAERITGPRRRYYMQYLLDDDGNPYPAGDNMYDRWQASKLLSNYKKRIVKKTFMKHRGHSIEISTMFLVFNHQYGDGPPILYETMVFSKISAIDGAQCRYDCKNSAKQGHDEVVKAVHQALKSLPRPASPTRRLKAQRRIAAGQDVLRRKPTKESNDHWMKRILKEAFGNMEGHEVAQALRLPDLRKRGAQ